MNLGQVLAHPERWRLLRVGADHFNGDRRTLWQILTHLAARAISFDRDRIKHQLEAVGIEPRFADDLAEEWLEHCTRISELEYELELRYQRRRLNVAGEVLVQTARDAGIDLSVLRLTAQRVRDDLADILARGERR